MRMSIDIPNPFDWRLRGAPNSRRIRAPIERGLGWEFVLHVSSYHGPWSSKKLAPCDVQDAEQKSVTSLEAQEILQRLASRELGMYSKVRRAGEPQWTQVSQIPELNTLCAFVNPKFASNSKVLSLPGRVIVTNDMQKLIDVSARARASPLFYTKQGFWAPIFDQQFHGVASVSCQIYRMWDNFWVGALVSPAQLSLGTEGASFTLYLFAINTETSKQDHELHSYDYPIPEDQTGNFSFSVPAGVVALHRIRIPVSKEKGAGDHVLTLRNVSTSGKVAKGVLVGALTLGSVVYKEGHRSFGITLRVLPPNVAPVPPAQAT